MRWENIFVDCVGVKEMDILVDDGTLEGTLGSYVLTHAISAS